MLHELGRIHRLGVMLGDAARRLTKLISFVLFGTNLALFRIFRNPFGDAVIQSQ